MTRVFFDMDGVLAEYKFVPFENLLEKGYFANLKPQEEVVRAILTLANNPNFEVHTLSAVLPENPYAVEEKTAWLEQYVQPRLHNITPIFVNCGEDKAAAVPGGIRPSDILIDDYNANLYAWAKNAKAIKLLNGVNHRHGSWKGIVAEKDTDSIVNTVFSVA